MAPLSYLGCTMAGIGCFIPSVAIMGSPTVFTQNMPAHRLGDMGAPHVCPPVAVCPPITVLGSTTVLINNMPAARLGDITSCGGFLMMGNFQVIVGG